VIENVEPQAGEIASTGWEDLYEPDFIEAINSFKHSTLYGLRALFEWLSRREPGTLADRIFQVFRTARADSTLFADGLTHERAFVDVLHDWHDEYVNGPSDLKESTRKARVVYAKAALESLARRDFRGIPKNFNRRWLTVGRINFDNTPSLGTANWPEFEELDALEREHRALDLVRKAFLSEFLLYAIPPQELP
jgi:hypothetical protein